MAYRLITFRVQFVADPPEFPRVSYCRTSEDVAIVARGIYRTLDADKEHFVLLALNNKNRVNGFKLISTGSLTASLVHPREVWRAALYLCAAAVVFVHNHPSGDPAPSPEDQDITRRLKETGDVLGIRVLDHVVLGHERFFSFSDRGLL
jgi:DNA repair protein RadC